MKRITIMLTYISLLAILFLANAYAEPIILPEKLTDIEAQSFYGDQSITVVIPSDNLLTIQREAFANSGLKEIYLPNSVVMISASAFSNCEGLLAHVVRNSYAEDYCRRYGITFDYQSDAPEPQTDYHAINPWGAGGATDNCFRGFCQTLERELGATVRVDNITGVAGTNGHKFIATSYPNGHTFGMITWELSTYKPLGILDYTWQNFDPICLLNREAAVLAVNAQWAEENGIANLPSFLEYCKANPDEILIGSSSSGSVWHIASGHLMNTTGIKYRVITFSDGIAAALSSAIKMEVHGIIASASDLRDKVESDDLICLGIMGDTRHPLLPATKTFHEQGYETEYYTSRGIALPKGCPDEVREAFRTACAAAANDPRFIQFMNTIGQRIVYLDSDKYCEFLEKQAQDVSLAMQTLELI